MAGGSAGGHLAGILLLDSNSHKQFSIEPEIFKGFLSIGGVLDFESCKSNNISGMIENLLGDDYLELYQTANPIHNIDRSINVNTLLIHSIDDDVVEYQNSANFKEKLEEYNSSTVVLHTIENASHTQTLFYPFIRDNYDTKVIDNWLGTFLE